MEQINNIDIRFPDPYGIKNALRNCNVQNPEFLDITLKSYKILSRFKNKKLHIKEFLDANENVSIFDHQILAAQKIKNSFGGTALLADEVGLGKTVEAGIIIKEFITTDLAKKILILAPPSLLPQWQDELRNKFDLDFINQKGDPRFHNAMSHDLLIMSHSSATYPKHANLLNYAYWDLVVVDEAHSMKNPDTFKHKLVKNLPKRNLLLLTATPIQNNLKELYNLIELLRPGYLGTWKQFREKYSSDPQFRMINSEYRNELQNILSTVVIRTTRNEVREYIKMADRIPSTRILEPTDDEKRLYDEITRIIQGQYVTNGDAFSLMIYQRLASSSTRASKRVLYKLKTNGVISSELYQKIMSVADNIQIDSKFLALLDMVQKNTSKFLIFTEFHVTQDYIRDNLEQNGFSVTLFNGKMSYGDRLESVQKFKGDTQIMISTAAGGEGQNLQFCHNIVNYDLPWNPMRIEQRIGRVHRIGQKNDVYIYNFALKGTIESYILDLLYVKINLFQMTLGDMDIMFEDSWAGGSPQTWFKEYMNASSEEERMNKFSSIGNDWKDRTATVNNAIHSFNVNVFKNFDLSSRSDK